MAQAKGVLPTRGEDREVLYKNPRMCGYFFGVQLKPDLNGEQVRAWLATVQVAVDALVARAPDPQSGVADVRKVASVAVGFASTFFAKLNIGAPVAVEVPGGFGGERIPAAGFMPNVPPLAAEVMFYISATEETRVNEFVLAVSDLNVVATVSMERGYQRSDETEPFGYKDGLRNIRRSERAWHVFVDNDEQHPDEPAWAHGGTYMATMKIVQNRAAFAALPSDEERDRVIGRRKDGTRLDLGGVAPHDESSAEATELPSNSHVRKAGPRGRHDDTQIFRRGLPFLEVTGDQVQVGLQFCSFQADPAQFDVVFNDWMMNQGFPVPNAGPDALLDPALRLTTVVHGGIFFVPPHADGGLLEALSRPEPNRQRARLVVNKQVTNPQGAPGPLERGGCVFHVETAEGVVVPGSEFTTASTGRGVCPVDLEIGQSYVLVETATPHPSVQVPQRVDFAPDGPRFVKRVVNELTQPSNGYV